MFSMSYLWQQVNAWISSLSDSIKKKHSRDTAATSFVHFLLYILDINPSEWERRMEFPREEWTGGTLTMGQRDRPSDSTNRDVRELLVLCFSNWWKCHALLLSYPAWIERETNGVNLYTIQGNIHLRTTCSLLLLSPIDLQNLYSASCSIITAVSIF